MTKELLVSIVFINLAFLFYTIGVWSEFKRKQLVSWHVVLFWLGVISDSIGTKLMIDYVGYIKFNIHTSTGFLGLALMVAHAIWASKVVVQNDSQKAKGFHKFSVFVWSVWFVSYVSGVFMGMNSVSG